MVMDILTGGGKAWDANSALRRERYRADPTQIGISNSSARSRKILAKVCPNKGRPSKTRRIGQTQFNPICGNAFVRMCLAIRRIALTGMKPQLFG